MTRFNLSIAGCRWVAKARAKVIKVISNGQTTAIMTALMLKSEPVPTFFFRNHKGRAIGWTPIFLWLAISSATAGFNETWFLLANEIYGAGRFTDPLVLSNAHNHCANTFTFHPPISSAMEQLVLDHQLNLVLQIFGSTYAKGLSSSYIESQRLELARFVPIASAAGLKVLWNPMPEWDQSGGRWANSRPHYNGMTRTQAYQAFTKYYTGTIHAPLGVYLSQTPAQRGVTLVAGQTDFPCNAACAYEWGVDMVVAERGIDELSDISTGIAFVRGLSRQYDKTWGIDLSTWRTANDGATDFDSQGHLLGGWSPSYCRRHMYISYLCGANLLQIEAAKYYKGASLNPFGLAVKEFGDFALVRHKDVGRPVVSMALMLDFHNGFDARHWIWGPAQEAVWYSEIPYSDGDHMINNFFKIAYPDHWLHGTTPGQPWTTPTRIQTAAFKAYLAGGGDPRPYEPMGSTRYGDNLDIIYSNASLDTLIKYKTIALIGSVIIDDRIRPRLLQFVQSGGTLVVNAKQATPADEPLLGVTLSSNSGISASAKWLSDGVVTTEESFTYTRVTPTTATVIANNNGADALITSNRVGKGGVILATPHYLQSSAKEKLLNVGVRLFDTLDAKNAIVRISGPPVEFIVNQGTGKTLVTIINNSLSGAVWNGTIEFNKPSTSFYTREWRSDATVSNMVSGNKVSILGSVPAFDLKIYALEFSL
jgi:hypothetical protein